jgi:hypothetical protein
LSDIRGQAEPHGLNKSTLFVERRTPEARAEQGLRCASDNECPRRDSNITANHGFKPSDPAPAQHRMVTDGHFRAPASFPYRVICLLCPNRRRTRGACAARPTGTRYCSPRRRGATRSRAKQLDQEPDEGDDVDALVRGPSGRAARLVHEQPRVVQLRLVGEDVRVGVRGHREVSLPHVLPDSRPGDAAEVEERDPPVAEIMG